MQLYDLLVNKFGTIFPSFTRGGIKQFAFNSLCHRSVATTKSSFLDFLSESARLVKPVVTINIYLAVS